MATYVSGYIQDLSAVKDNIKLRVRILRTWMQPVYGKPHVINMEMIIIDEQNNKMQATIRMALINGFKHQLEEGNAVTLQRYSLGEIKPQYRMVKQGLRLSFLSNTLVEKCADFTGSIHGFEFRPFKTITDLLDEEVGQFDVIGQVVACGELDNYDKNGKPGKKKPITLIDAEGTELNATLWGSYAEQFSEFLTSSTDHGKIIAVIQLAMMKLWDKKMCVQNAYWGTKLFLLNGTDAISSPEFKDIEDFRKRLLEMQQTDKSEMVYLSCDSVDKSDRGSAIDESVFSPEFINGLKFSGVPNHKLVLKVGVPVMLLRNIDQSNGLCNGTRLQVTRLSRTSIQAQIINGTHFGNKVIIPRLRITPSDKRLPLKIVRKQYPLSVSFAMTINKSQGQSLSKVGLYLPRPVFTHGQLYVAVSRVKSKRGLKVVVCDADGNLSNTTTNVVYKEVLQGL